MPRRGNEYVFPLVLVSYTATIFRILAKNLRVPVCYMKALRNLNVRWDSGPLQFMHEDQIDGDVWTIPGEAQKEQKGATTEFRIPLSKEALRVIESTMLRDGYLFPSPRKGLISDATTARHMERAKLDARLHGFRTSLRELADGQTGTRFEVAEMALSHRVGGAVERAYAP